MTCAACGTENPAGRKFCRECGAALALACPSCGTPNPPDDKFCGECGTPLTAVAAAPPVVQPAAERRLVSVLFADLVGFTTASEGRDSEETRELLSRYFEIARTLIERYGGTVEKFIGDAVMAVWGTPVAQEDDAERAVRTALDLVAAVPELDGGLRARAGVLTGEAAVTLGATGQGMVAGDLVNTASRIQSAAEPGTVLVGESTRRATEAAVAYEDAGEQALKGKAEPERLSRAVRVLSARGGALRSDGLEPPFVGRDRELRLVKELFHTASEQRKAHLVSVVGIAGIGKSRIAWEFEKYIDGLVEQVAWHRGRCLAYGEGVAYWALAEMVRMRARITEEESSGEALAKLRATLGEHVPDEEERAWLEPRLAHLLGLGETIAAEREELFSAWRLFFERLANEGACALVFEDLQWAEPGLLDFVDHLLEWSRGHPIFVLALQRPDLAERGLTLGAASRNATTLALEPLPQAAMEQLLDGFIPGLPDDLRTGILERAEGIPLYAVETVRMLLDRGLVVREGAVYRPTGPIEALAVPETLHALLAARLDGLEADERSLVQDAAVLGKTFTKQGLAAVSGRSEADIDSLLTRLVRKEVFSLQMDPRSPERGQCGFLQDLLKRVAYETLSKRERKARHLAAAAYLATAWADEQEIVEVVASHYVDAYRLDPDADDAEEIKAHAREALTRAGERAASLAATEEAARVFSAAAELAVEPLAEAELRAKAGRAAYDGGAFAAAEEEFERAHELYAEAGAARDAALNLAQLGNTEWQMHQGERAIERMEEGLAALAGAEPDEGIAALTAEVARAYFFRGNLEAAQERVDQAIGFAEELWAPEVLSTALNTAGLLASFRGRPEYGLALNRHALDIALENDLARVALRAYINLADRLDARDRWDEALAYQERGLALARRVGSRTSEWRFLGEMGLAHLYRGSWDDAAAVAERIPEDRVVGAGAWLVFELALRRGDLDSARAQLARLEALDPGDAQDSGVYHLTQAQLFNAEGRHEQALPAARQAVADLRGSGVPAGQGKMAYIEALAAAQALGDEAAVRELLTELEAQPPGLLPPMLRAHVLWYRGLLGEEPEQRFKAAAALLREYSLVPLGALVDVDHAGWLVDQGRPDDARAVLDEARAVFERIGARPWLERLDAVDARLGTLAAPAT